MQADLPFFESPEEALRAAVQALKGTKQVGPQLWPDKSQDNASKLLSDCLNTGRPEKLEIGQMMLIFKLARDIGYHAPMQWFAAEVGYDARPITRAEEVDRVTLVVEQSTKTLAHAVATLERLQRARVAA